MPRRYSLIREAQLEDGRSDQFVRCRPPTGWQRGTSAWLTSGGAGRSTSSSTARARQRRPLR